MKKIINLLILLFVSLSLYSQNIYIGKSKLNSDIIFTVRNGYIYQSISYMTYDLVAYFDGKYLYRLQNSEYYTQSDIILTYMN